MPEKIVFEWVGTIDLVDYPESYKEVLDGTAMWNKRIDYLGDPTGKFTSLIDYNVHDPQHPRCYWCGKFVPKIIPWGWDGPCKDCNEDTRWY